MTDVNKESTSEGNLKKNNSAKNSNKARVVNQNYVYNLNKQLVRIEYPGLVNNIPKAVETLGGIYNVEMVIGDSKRKMELKFHADNKYNKACISDRDSNTGLLIKVSRNHDYEIIGFVSENFKFNKAVDFQYLPFVQNENNGNTEYIYDKIFPNELPNLEFLISKENVNLHTFLLPSSFSRYDTSHHTLYLKAGEKFNLDINIRPELFKIFDRKPRKKFQYKQISQLVNIFDSNLKIPDKPKELAMKIIRDKCLEDQYNIVTKCFQERPMWIRSAIQHKANISTQLSKLLIPAAAYLWSIGPWRMVWTRLGYDPRTDFTSRIYQTLDFRIRESEGTKIIIPAKKSRQFPLETLNETHYALTSDCIPPARQMFYQFCDIRIPEIQDMVQRLPKGVANQKFDVKNGWLPVNFSEQCREIANRYVMENVHQELLANSMKAQSLQQEKETDEDEEENPLSYSSRMLNRMKEGFKKSIEMTQNDDDMGIVVLSDDDSDDDAEQGDISTRLDDDEEEEEQASDNSEMELDMEVVEEINQLISDTKKD